VKHCAPAHGAKVHIAAPRLPAIAHNLRCCSRTQGAWADPESGAQQDHRCLRRIRKADSRQSPSLRRHRTGQPV